MNSRATDPVVLVLGYGNLLRGDDGVGWHVAQRLERELRRPDVRVITCHQLTPELPEPLSRARLAIFIDASAEDAPGAVSQRNIEPGGAGLIRDSHELGPAALLTTAKLLFGACPRAVLFTVGGADFSLREQLSETVQRSADEVVVRLARVIEEFMTGSGYVSHPESRSDVRT